jgi:hypothetical protein
MMNARDMMDASRMVDNMPMATPMMACVCRVTGENKACQGGGQTDGTVAKPVLGFGTPTKHRAPRP